MPHGQPEKILERARTEAAAAGITPSKPPTYRATQRPERRAVAQEVRRAEMGPTPVSRDYAMRELTRLKKLRDLAVQASVARARGDTEGRDRILKELQAGFESVPTEPADLPDDAGPRQRAHAAILRGHLLTAGGVPPTLAEWAGVARATARDLWDIQQRHGEQSGSVIRDALKLIGESNPQLRRAVLGELRGLMPAEGE